MSDHSELPPDKTLKDLNLTQAYLDKMGKDIVEELFDLEPECDNVVVGKKHLELMFANIWLRGIILGIREY